MSKTFWDKQNIEFDLILAKRNTIDVSELTMKEMIFYTNNNLYLRIDTIYLLKTKNHD